MGIVSEARDIVKNRGRNSMVIASPAEDQKAMAAEDTVQEGIRAGAKAAAIACVAIAIPTLIAVRKIPWAKRNLNYTGQALVVSAASIAAFFITVDKAILKGARRNSKFDKGASDSGQ